MTEQIREVLQRDKQLLEATIAFIQKNHLHSLTVRYDEAICDGHCLIEDCMSQLEFINYQLGEAQ